eukprot:761389-Hanusia_phi.AAC.2
MLEARECGKEGEKDFLSLSRFEISTAHCSERPVKLKLSTLAVSANPFTPLLLPPPPSPATFFALLL